LPSQISGAIILTVIAVGIALLISFMLKEPRSDYRHTEEGPIEIVKQSFLLIRNNKSLKRIVLLGLFTTPFAGYLRNFHPPYFELAGINPVFLGISLGVGGLISVLASKYAYKVEELMGVGKGLLLANLLPGIFYILMAIFISPVLSLLIFTLNFGLMSLQDPLLSNYYNIHIKSEIRATALSSINMFSSIYIALMGLLIGWIADLSLLGSLVFMGVIVIIASWYFKIDAGHVAENKNIV